MSAQDVPVRDHVIGEDKTHRGDRTGIAVHLLEVIVEMLTATLVEEEMMDTEKGLHHVRRHLFQGNPPETILAVTVLVLAMIVEIHEGEDHVLLNVIAIPEIKVVEGGQTLIGEVIRDLPELIIRSHQLRIT